MEVTAESYTAEKLKPFNRGLLAITSVMMIESTPYLVVVFLPRNTRA